MGEGQYAPGVSRDRPDAPDGRGQPAGTGGGGASYALDGLALQERENISACTVLATGENADNSCF